MSRFDFLFANTVDEEEEANVRRRKERESENLFSLTPRFQSIAKPKTNYGKSAGVCVYFAYSFCCFSLDAALPVDREAKDKLW
jgi:hypothetical protein